MVAAIYRKFTDKPITHSMAHHLNAVAHLLTAGGYARVSDIARFLDLTRGSVSISMKGLRECGFVAQDDNRFFHLTEKGLRTVRSLRTRYEVVKRFLVDVLGVKTDDAHFQSCQIAHLVTIPTTRRLATFLEKSSPQLMAVSLSHGCPNEYPPCETPGIQAGDPKCDLECLAEWVPSLENIPPCKEINYDGT